MPSRQTSYKGLSLNQNEMKELKNQPISNFLRFEKDGDGYIAQQKLPKVGTFDGKDFNPERGMNVFTKALGNYFFTDKNKIIDYNSFDKKYDTISDIYYQLDLSMPKSEMANPVKYENQLNSLISELNIPKNEIENTKTFLKAISNNGSLIVNEVYSDVGRLRKFNHVVQTFNNLTEDKKQDYKNFINKNKEDITNLQNRLFAFKDINIDKNEKLIYSSDCIISSQVTSTIADCFNKYCDTHENYKDQKIVGQREDLSLAHVKHDKNTQELKFNQHHLYGAEVKLNGKNVYLTLETTAPAADEFAHEPKDQKNRNRII